MTLPWWLNPWVEVLELRREAYEQHKWAVRERDNALSERIARKNTEAENAELKRKVDALHAYCSCLEGKKPLCGCQQCTDARLEMSGPGKPGWRYACEKCGNKRCAHHQWHEFKCTGSNEPDQVGEVG